MARRERCVLPGVPVHITQRGVNRCETFSSDRDRSTYLRLIAGNLSDARVHILGWCLMTNHIHLIALPECEDSLAILLRRAHGRYAQYYNAAMGRSGHLWQNRFFACALGDNHLWKALAYVDRNPLRAGMVPPTPHLPARRRYPASYRSTAPCCRTDTQASRHSAPSRPADCM
jgi:putative transposase